MKQGTGLKKSALLALIALVLIVISSAVGLGTFAAYTNSRNAQRTIASYDKQGERFSSNILGRGFGKDNVKTLYVANATITPSSVVTVCNYERGKQSLPYSENIGYTITLRFVYFDNSDENKYVPVDATYMANLTAYQATISNGSQTVTLSSSHFSDTSFSGTLTGSTTDSDAYTLTYGTNYISGNPNLFVEMTATPNVTGMHAICAVFKAEVRAQGATDSWTGRFLDSESVQNPTDCDGYNYSISGFGTGTCTLTWDSTKVSISAYSLLTLLAIEGATQPTSNSVVFAVDSDEVSRYDVQFYKVNIPAGTTWTQMNNSVVTLQF